MADRRVRACCAARQPIYLTPFTTEQATIQFALGQPRVNFKWFDGRKCLVSPPPERSATLLIVNEDFRTLARAQQYWPSGQLAQPVQEFSGRTYLSVFAIPAQAWNFTPQVATRALWSGQTELLGYTIAFENQIVTRVQAGQGVPLTLFWRVVRPLDKDYTVFAHLLGPHNPRTNSPLWGQRDQQPCEGFYPTTRWSVGEVIVEDFNLVAAKDAPAGSYHIALGLYDLTSGARLSLADGADQLLIGPIEIFR